MLRKKIRISAQIVLIGICFSLATSAGYCGSMDDISFITEQYPPFNMKKDGRLQGIAIDLMGKMLVEIGSTQTRENIKLLPWALGYKRIQATRNTCLFSMTRTAERENMFKWVGPIAPTKISVLALKKRNIKIRSEKDLAKFKAGVIRDDIGDQMANKAGIKKKNIQRVSSNTANIKKLLRGRIDIWIYEESVAKWQIKSAGFNPNDFEVVYVLKKGELFFAFHKETPDSQIDQFQKALDGLKSTKEHETILNKYLK
ncbi:MAG: ABC transporter substrate-binding protein [Proteobacteria bacterium]|nr:ABC transporter substrate-binding protein [Pseudomonadota bacterium]